MYEQLSKELKASLFQRIKSPFFGSFFIGWFIFNYRFIIVLFSDKSIEEKFQLIDTTNLIMNVKPLLIPFTNFQIEPIYLTTLIYPFLIALIYIGIVPFFEYYISMPIWKKHQNRLKEKYAELEKEEIFLGTEKDKYLNEIMNVKKERNKLIEELTTIDLSNQTKTENIIQKKEYDFLREKEKLKTDFQIQLADCTKDKDEELEKEKKRLNLEIKQLKEELNYSNQNLTNLQNGNETFRRTLSEQLKEIVDKKEEDISAINLKNKELENDLKEKEKEISYLKKFKEEKKELERIQELKKIEILKEFSEDEIVFFETIYKYDLKDNLPTSNFIDNMIKVNSTKRIKLEKVISDLIIKKLIVTNSIDYVFYSREIKDLIYNAFN